jgi:Flp pilus assembly protein TadD/serine/threonine protein kinase
MLTPNVVLQKRYRVIRQIGNGGMGAVYEAIDERLSSIVALKETFPQNDAAREAFRREAQLLANLDHDVFPKVNDYFWEGDGQYLVMDFIKGNDLAELMRLRESPFAAAKVLGWADQLLEALEELHAYNPPIVHRDIKPSNLKLTPKGKIILLDFGIAKGTVGLMTTGEADDKTMKSFTPHYAPLEQSIRSSEELREALSTIDEDAVRKVMLKGTDPKTDIYSLGATLYHLLTNVIPDAASTRVMKIWRGKPDPLRLASDVNPQVPPKVAEILSRAMEVERARRPSAAEMRQLLRELVGEELQLPETPAVTFLPAEIQQKGERQEKGARAEVYQRSEDKYEEIGEAAEARKRPDVGKAAQVIEEEQRPGTGGERDKQHEAREDARELGEDDHPGPARETVPLTTEASLLEEQTPTPSLMPEKSPSSVSIYPPSDNPSSSTLPPERGRQKTRRLLWLIGALVALIVAVVIAAVAFKRSAVSGDESGAARKTQAEQHAKVGLDLLYKGRWAQAVREFSQAVQLEPENAQLHVKLGDSLSAQGKNLGAETEYKEGERLAKLEIQLNPNSASAHDALGGAIFGQAYPVAQRAESEYREAVKLDPMNAFYHTDLGRALLNRSKYKEAEAEIREAIRLEPNIAVNYDDLGSALSLQNKDAEAEEAYRKAIGLDPTYPFYRRDLANSLDYQKKKEEAENEYKEVERLFKDRVQQEPNDAAYHMDLGSFLASRKNYPEAEVQFREAIRLESNESSYHGALATLYDYYQNNPAAAEAEYREEVRLQPNWANWHNDLGYHYLRNKNYAEAEAEIKEAIRLEPIGNYHDSLGDVLRGEEKYPEAETEYREAIRLTPDFALFHVNLASALAQQKKYEEAEAQIQEAIKLEPDMSSFRAQLGDYFFQRKRYADAEAEYRKAIKMDSSNGYYHDSLAIVLALLKKDKKDKEAEDEFRKAIDLGPDIALFRADLGTFFFNHKRYTEAEAEYREAIKLEPNNAAYHNTLGNILTWQHRSKDSEDEYQEAIRLEPGNNTFRENLRSMEKRNRR